jgi:TetR/AcrR family transcriptional repressor of nem operon
MIGHIGRMPQRSKAWDIGEAGLRLVHARGFVSTGVAAIAEEAGAPKGSFYNHFASKDAFGVAILDRYEQRIAAALAPTVEGVADPLDGIRRYFEQLRELGAVDGFAAGCLVGNLCAELTPVSPLVRARLVELLAAWRRPIASAIARARTPDEDGPTADQVAAVLLDAWQGALLRAKAERTSEPLDGFLAITLPALLGRGGR